MHVHVSKWGNSLGLRLPQAFARQAGITEGQTVNVIADGNRLIIEAATPSYRLQELLHNVSRQAMSDAFDWGNDMGRENVCD